MSGQLSHIHRPLHMANPARAGSSSCAAVPGTPLALDTIRFQCGRCGGPCSIADSTPVNRSKPLYKRNCNCCGASDRKLQRSFQVDASAKQAWESKSAQEKLNHYKQRTRMPKWSRGPEMTESSVAATDSITDNCHEHVVDLDILVATWVREEHYKHADLSQEQWKAEWSRVVNETEEPKVWRRNQWRLGRFDGIEVKKRATRAVGQTVERRGAW